MDEIRKAIAEKFRFKNQYAEAIGVKETDLPSKMKVIENKINWLNKVLEPLSLTVKIVKDEK